MHSCSSQEPGWGMALWGSVSSSWALLSYWWELVWSSGSLPNHCMCEPQCPVVMGSFSSSLPRQPLPWKRYHSQIQVRGDSWGSSCPTSRSKEGQRWGQPTANSKLGERSSVSKLRFGKGQWTFSSSWHERQPSSTKQDGVLLFTPNPMTNDDVNLAAFLPRPAHAFNHWKSHGIQKDPKP